LLRYMTTFSLLFSSPFSWLPCAISPPCKFASLALKRPYFLWARSSTPKILRYGCCNVNQKMHIAIRGTKGQIPVLLCRSAALRFCLVASLMLRFVFGAPLRCATGLRQEGSICFHAYPPLRLRLRSPSRWANLWSRLRRSEHG